MEAVRAFNNELSAVYEVKPPISRQKMANITKLAIKSIKFYKHVVQSVEKFIQKCRPEYKVPGLYVIDSIVRQSRHQFGHDRDVFAGRFVKNITGTFQNLFKCPSEEKSKLIRVLNLWQKNSVFPSEIIQPLLDLAADPGNQHLVTACEAAASEFMANKKPVPIPTLPKSSHKKEKSSRSKKESSEDVDEAQNDVLKTVTQLLQAQDDSGDQELQLQQLQVLQQQLTAQTFLSAPQEQPTIDSTVLAQIQTLTNQLLGNDEKPPEFNKKLLEFDYGESDEEEEKKENDSTLSGVQNLLNDPGLMQQIQQMSETLKQTQNLKNEIGQRQQMLEQQEAEFNRQLSTSAISSYSNAPPMGVPHPDAGPDDDITKIEGDYDNRDRHGDQERDDDRRSRRRRRSRSRSRSPRKRSRRSRSRDRRRSRSRSRDRRSRSQNNLREKEREDDRLKREKERERRHKGLPPIQENKLSVCSTTIWIGHIAKLTSEDEIRREVEAHGEVDQIHMIPPRGCAFIVLKRRKDAARVVEKLRGVKVNGSDLKVAYAPGKGVKGSQFKNFWDVDVGTSFIPWTSVPKTMDELTELQDGGQIDEDSASDEIKKILSGESLVPITEQPPMPMMPGMPFPMPPGMMPMMPMGMLPPMMSMPPGMPPRGPPPGMPPRGPPGMPPTSIQGQNQLPMGMRPPLMQGGLPMMPPGMPPMLPQGPPPKDDMHPPPSNSLAAAIQNIVSNSSIITAVAQGPPRDVGPRPPGMPGQIPFPMPQMRPPLPPATEPPSPVNSRVPSENTGPLAQRIQTIASSSTPVRPPSREEPDQNKNPNINSMLEKWKKQNIRNEEAAMGNAGGANVRTVPSVGGGTRRTRFSSNNDDMPSDGPKFQQEEPNVRVLDRTLEPLRNDPGGGGLMGPRPQFRPPFSQDNDMRQEIRPQFRDNVSPMGQPPSQSPRPMGPNMSPMGPNGLNNQPPNSMLGPGLRIVNRIQTIASSVPSMLSLGQQSTDAPMQPSMLNLNSGGIRSSGPIITEIHGQPVRIPDGRGIGLSMLRPNVEHRSPAPGGLMDPNNREAPRMSIGGAPVGLVRIPINGNPMTRGVIQHGPNGPILQQIPQTVIRVGMAPRGPEGFARFGSPMGQPREMGPQGLGGLGGLGGPPRLMNMNMRGGPPMEFRGPRPGPPGMMRPGMVEMRPQFDPRGPRLEMRPPFDHRGPNPGMDMRPRGPMPGNFPGDRPPNMQQMEDFFRGPDAREDNNMMERQDGGFRGNENDNNDRDRDRDRFNRGERDEDRRSRDNENRGRDNFRGRGGRDFGGGDRDRSENRDRRFGERDRDMRDNRGDRDMRGDRRDRDERRDDRRDDRSRDRDDRNRDRDDRYKDRDERNTNIRDRSDRDERYRDRDRSDRRDNRDTTRDRDNSRDRERQSSRDRDNARERDHDTSKDRDNNRDKDTTREKDSKDSNNDKEEKSSVSENKTESKPDDSAENVPNFKPAFKPAFSVEETALPQETKVQDKEEEVVKTPEKPTEPAVPLKLGLAIKLNKTVPLDNAPASSAFGEDTSPTHKMRPLSDMFADDEEHAPQSDAPKLEEPAKVIVTEEAPKAIVTEEPPKVNVVQEDPFKKPAPPTLGDSPFKVPLPVSPKVTQAPEVQIETPIVENPIVKAPIVEAPIVEPPIVENQIVEPVADVIAPVIESVEPTPEPESKSKPVVEEAMESTPETGSEEN